jgi:uncharacterized protein (TIGR02246 family)
MDDTQRNEVTAAIQGAMHSFGQAERARDAEALLAHFAPVPDFHLYSDGVRLSYDAVAAGVRQTFPTLRSIEGGFGDLTIIVIARDAALATATFRETITDASGQSTRLRGAASWLWRQVDGRWRIVYGHTHHYPDTEA